MEIDNRNKVEVIEETENPEEHALNRNSIYTKIKINGRVIYIGIRELDVNVFRWEEGVLFLGRQMIEEIKRASR